MVEIAAELRHRSDQSEPAFSTRQIIDACFPHALVTGRRLPDGIDEVVSETPQGIVILYRRGLPTPSQRFVIAHAIAHVIFDRKRGGCRIGSTGQVSREKRADRFAAELLLPLAYLSDYVGTWPDDADQERYLDQVDEIASHFQVPIPLVDRRIRELSATRNRIAKGS